VILRALRCPKGCKPRSGGGKCAWPPITSCRSRMCSLPGDGNLPTRPRSVLLRGAAPLADPERAEELAGLIVRACRRGAVDSPASTGSGSTRRLHAADFLFSEGGPRRVSTGSVRVRPARARPTPQGDADAAALWQVPGAVSASPPRRAGVRGRACDHPRDGRSRNLRGGRLDPRAACVPRAVAPLLRRAAATKLGMGRRRGPNPAIELPHTAGSIGSSSTNRRRLTALLQAGVFRSHVHRTRCGLRARARASIHRSEDPLPGDNGDCAIGGAHSSRPRLRPARHRLRRSSRPGSLWDSRSPLSDGHIAARGVQG